MVIGFHDDILKFFAQILFDGGFVPFLNFGVIGKHADGAEVLLAMSFIGREEFLHGFAGVRVVVKDAIERGVTRADTGQGVAKGIGFFGGALAGLAQFTETGLQRRGSLLKRFHLAACVAPGIGGLLSIFTNADRGFQEFGFAGFELLQRIALMDKRFLGLLLFAVKAKNAFTRFGGGAAQGVHASFGFGDLRGTERGAVIQFFDTGVDGDGFAARRFDGLLLRGVAELPFEALRVDGLVLGRELRVAPSKFFTAGAVKSDAIFAAIDFESRLVQNILV